MLYELRTVKEQSTVAHFDENEVPALCSMDLFGFASSMWLQCTSSGCVNTGLSPCIRHKARCAKFALQTNAKPNSLKLLDEPTLRKYGKNQIVYRYLFDQWKIIAY